MPQDCKCQITLYSRQCMYSEFRLRSKIPFRHGIRVRSGIGVRNGRRHHLLGGFTVLVCSLHESYIYSRLIQQTEQAAYFYNFMEPEEESRMHAEPESETISYWDSWYSSHFPLPQWSLTPETLRCSVEGTYISYAINY